MPHLLSLSALCLKAVVVSTVPRPEAFGIAGPSAWSVLTTWLSAWWDLASGYMEERRWCQQQLRWRWFPIWLHLTWQHNCQSVQERLDSKLHSYGWVPPWNYSKLRQLWCLSLRSWSLWSLWGCREAQACFHPSSQSPAGPLNPNQETVEGRRGSDAAPSWDYSGSQSNLRVSNELSSQGFHCTPQEEVGIQLKCQDAHSYVQSPAVWPAAAEPCGMAPEWAQKWGWLSQFRLIAPPGGERLSPLYSQSSSELSG